MKQPTERIAYRVSELVKATGISRTTIYRLIATGEIPGVKLGTVGNCVVVIPAWFVHEKFGTPSKPSK